MLTVPSPGGLYEKERWGPGAVFLASWFCTHSLRLLLHSLDSQSSARASPGLGDMLWARHEGTWLCGLNTLIPGLGDALT